MQGVLTQSHVNIVRVVRGEHGLNVGGDLVSRRKEKLLLRHRAEDRVDLLVVVRSFLSIHTVENHLELAPEDGNLVGVLSVRLGREETDEAVFPRDLAVARELLDSYVVHPGQSVYGRASVGLGDDQMGPSHHQVSLARVGFTDQNRLSERRFSLVAEHPEARPPPYHDRGITIQLDDVVFAVTQEYETAVPNPPEERLHLLQLFAQTGQRRYTFSEFDHGAVDCIDHGMEVVRNSDHIL